jgi:hypothetical protein
MHNSQMSQCYKPQRTKHALARHLDHAVLWGRELSETTKNNKEVKNTAKARKKIETLKGKTERKKRTKQ